MLIGGDTRVAQRAKENGVKLVAQHFDGARRERDALAEILIRAPVEFDKFEWPLGPRRHRFQDLHCLRSDFRPNAIAWYDLDSCRGASTPHRNARQSLASSTSAIRAV